MSSRVRTDAKQGRDPRPPFLQKWVLISGPTTFKVGTGTVFRARRLRCDPRSRCRARRATIDGVFRPRISPVGRIRASGRSMGYVLKTRFADLGPNSPSRRRPRGAKSRFGPLVDRSCRVQRATEDGTDPGAPWSYSGLRNTEWCADIPFGARITLRCPWILAGVIPCL